VILGKSHTRKMAANLPDKLPDTCEVIGFTKPTANIEMLVTSKYQDLNRLSSKGVPSFMGGTNGRELNNISKDLRQISTFV
jgi:hypothetical protein